VKVNNRLQPEIKKGTNSSGSEIFLNSIIILLVGLTFFLAYSLVTKTLSIRDREEIKSNQKKSLKIIQVEVLNGCGATGVADRFTNFLRSKGFDVVQMGNYRSYDIDETLIIDRTGNKLNANRVAESLGVDKKNVIQQINQDYFLDVSLVIGKDFNKLLPTN
jgi:hypothetical protein